MHEDLAKKCDRIINKRMGQEVKIEWWFGESEGGGGSRVNIGTFSADLVMRGFILVAFRERISNIKNKKCSNEISSKIQWEVAKCQHKI